MINNTFQQHFHEANRHLQLYFEQSNHIIAQLEGEIEQLKKELSQKQQRPSYEHDFILPLVLEILCEMKLEDSLPQFLQLLSSKIGPKTLAGFVHYLRKLFGNHKYFELEAGIDSFVQTVNSLSTVPQPIIINFIQLLKEIFISEYNDLDEMDLCYQNSLQAVVNIEQPECKERIKSFLKHNFDLAVTYFLNSNQPELIVNYMYGLLHHGLDRELSTFVKQMVVPERPFLDANVDKRRFYRFLYFMEKMSNWSEVQRKM